MDFFIYIAKSAGILTLFYFVYVLVLRKDTFFSANRTYLLIGIIASLLLPLLTITTTTVVEVPVSTLAEESADFIPTTVATQAMVDESLDIWQVVFWI